MTRKMMTKMMTTANLTNAVLRDREGLLRETEPPWKNQQRMMWKRAMKTLRTRKETYLETRESQIKEMSIQTFIKMQEEETSDTPRSLQTSK
jgi:hypothetical protein